MLYPVHLAMSRLKLITFLVIDTDCTGSCKSNYRTIMTMVNILMVLNNLCHWKEESVFLVTLSWPFLYQLINVIIFNSKMRGI